MFDKEKLCYTYELIVGNLENLNKVVLFVNAHE